jgi:hypothetical protein
MAGPIGTLGVRIGGGAAPRPPKALGEGPRETFGQELGRVLSEPAPHGQRWRPSRPLSRRRVGIGSHLATPWVPAVGVGGGVPWAPSRGRSPGEGLVAPHAVDGVPNPAPLPKHPPQPTSIHPRSKAQEVHALAPRVAPSSPHGVNLSPATIPLRPEEAGTLGAGRVRAGVGVGREVSKEASLPTRPGRVQGLAWQAAKAAGLRSREPLGVWAPEAAMVAAAGGEKVPTGREGTLQKRPSFHPPSAFGQAWDRPQETGLSSRAVAQESLSVRARDAVTVAAGREQRTAAGQGGAFARMPSAPGAIVSRPASAGSPHLLPPTLHPVGKGDAEDTQAPLGSQPGPGLAFEIAPTPKASGQGSGTPAQGVTARREPTPSREPGPSLSHGAGVLLAHISPPHDKTGSLPSSQGSHGWPAGGALGGTDARPSPTALPRSTEPSRQGAAPGPWPSSPLADPGPQAHAVRFAVGGEGGGQVRGVVRVQAQEVSTHLTAPWAWAHALREGAEELGASLAAQGLRLSQVVVSDEGGGGSHGQETPPWAGGQGRGRHGQEAVEPSHASPPSGRFDAQA